jgi:hypothetical protein
MKLLIVTTLREFKNDVSAILKKAGIQTFSFSETIGIKTSHVPNIYDDWFTSDSNHEYRSVFFFSFTDEEKAQSVFKELETFNTLERVDYPVHGFILPVEKAM